VLTDDQYAQAYTQIQQICLNREIMQKAGTDEQLWQAALEDLVNQNTNINFAIKVRRGTPQELKDRRTVLD